MVDGSQQFDELPTLTLGTWATIDVYIPTEEYDSAITPYMMKGWVELQRSIYRAYSLAQGGEAEARSLTEKEKKELELVVEVKSGSSDQSVDVQKVLETVASTMVDKMEPTHVLITVLTLILTIGGASTVKSWLAGRKEVKLAEIEALKNKEVVKGHTAALETIAEVVAVDQKRAALVSRAAREVPIVAGLEAEVDRGREALVKHVSKDDVVINNVPVSSAAGQAVTSRTRIMSTEVRLDGLYKIRKVDTTMATGFRVHLIDAEGKELVGDVAEVMTTAEDRYIIQEAEWKKLPVHLQINAKERRDKLTDAVIIRARAHDPDTDGEWR